MSTAFREDDPLGLILPDCKNETTGRMLSAILHYLTPKHTERLYEALKHRFMCLGVPGIAPLSTQIASISYKIYFGVLRGITTPYVINMLEVKYQRFMIFTQNKTPELHIHQPVPQSRMLSSAQRLRPLERSLEHLLIVRIACFAPVIQKISHDGQLLRL